MEYGKMVENGREKYSKNMQVLVSEEVVDHRA